MKIHLITNLFQPDELAGAALYTDLAIYLKDRGHDVRVTTTFPYYPAWKLRDEDRDVAVRDELFQNIPIRRIGMYVPAKPKGLNRVLSDLSFFIGLLRNATFADWTPEVVLTASPMLSQCLAQHFLYSFVKIPRIIIVQDFVVDAALELRILKAPGIANTLLGLENWSFKSARTIITINQAMLEKLRGKLGSSRRLVMLSNWIHSSLQSTIDIQRQHNLPRDSNVLFYSGNLGVKQGLPECVKLFAECRTDWRLKIHGGGAEAEKLRRQVDHHQGIELGSILRETDYVRELCMSTACLITQRPGIGANFLPSKLLPALASGTPVLAICDQNAPLGVEVMEGRFGEIVSFGDQKKLEKTLVRWTQEPALLNAMSRNALIYSQKFHRDNILGEYEGELQRLVKPDKAAEETLEPESSIHL